MKINRDQLKGLIREVLVEILSEGIGGAMPQVQQRVIQQPQQRTQVQSRISGNASDQRTRKFDPRLDTPIDGNKQLTRAVHEAVKRESGGNPVLAELLADTAMNTLPQMIENDNAGASKQGTVQFEGSVEEAFGDEIVDRWSALAFNTQSPKR